ncbi:MAG: hypothetical protein CBC05_08455 [Crocinitomicaceae bacterium TMED45]|nr:MAG: hypothetical protein CBC05_08455 [Crocinitomicaceae bacterium TMED45]
MSLTFYLSITIQDPLVIQIDLIVNLLLKTASKKEKTQEDFLIKKIIQEKKKLTCYTMALGNLGQKKIETDF